MWTKSLEMFCLIDINIFLIISEERIENFPLFPLDSTLLEKRHEHKKGLWGMLQYCLSYFFLKVLCLGFFFLLPSHQFPETLIYRDCWLYYLNSVLGFIIFFLAQNISFLHGKKQFSYFVLIQFHLFFTFLIKYSSFSSALQSSLTVVPSQNFLVEQNHLRLLYHDLVLFIFLLIFFLLLLDLHFFAMQRLPLSDWLFQTVKAYPQAIGWQYYEFYGAGVYCNGIVNLFVQGIFNVNNLVGTQAGENDILVANVLGNSDLAVNQKKPLLVGLIFFENDVANKCLSDGLAGEVGLEVFPVILREILQAVKEQLNRTGF